MTVTSAPAAEPKAVSTKPSDALPQAVPLPASQLALIKATVPVLQQHGEAITKVMYDSLIAAHPELRDIFSSTSQATGRQPRALARAVLAYAAHIDDLPRLAHAVERIAQKHVSLFVRPAQYGVVGEYLIRAIGTVLGPAATPDVVAAWTAAYGVLASVFIGREADLYRADAEEGGNGGGGGWAWTGWREFRVARRVFEAPGIVSLYLAPADGVVPLPGFLPGQYVSVQVDVPRLGHKQSRQYSLSDAPDMHSGSHYRVSIKREEGGAVVSNLLHDQYREGDSVALSHPHGEFFLDPADASREGHPVVLISAGVGATPLLSMLKTFAQGASVAGRRRGPVSWIHTSRSKEALPFGEEVASAVDVLREKGVTVATHVHLRQEAGSRMDLSTLDGEGELFVRDPRAEYFVCGPEVFMFQARRTLMELGVGKERIHLELFATGDVEDE